MALPCTGWLDSIFTQLNTDYKHHQKKMIIERSKSGMEVRSPNVNIYIKQFTMFRIILIRLRFWYRISRKVKNLAIGSEYPSKSHFALVTELRSQKFSL